VGGPVVHDVHLAVHLLQVRRVQLRLVDDLDGHLQQNNIAVPPEHTLPSSDYLPTTLPSQSIRAETAGDCMTRATLSLSALPGILFGTTRHIASNVQITSRNVCQ
jgi:Protein related to penicillin acylase